MIVKQLIFILGRRWRKSCNFTRKRKDTLNTTSGTTNNTNKNISINDNVDIDNNDISKINFENDEYDEFSYVLTLYH